MKGLVDRLEEMVDLEVAMDLLMELLVFMVEVLEVTLEVPQLEQLELFVLFGLEILGNFHQQELLTNKFA